MLSSARLLDVKKPCTRRLRRGSGEAGASEGGGQCLAAELMGDDGSDQDDHQPDGGDVPCPAVSPERDGADRKRDDDRKNGPAGDIKGSQQQLTVAFLSAAGRLELTEPDGPR